MGRGGTRFRREERLLHSRDFQRLGRAGRRAASSHFIVLATRRGEVDPGTPRLGITASRKVGRAVQRNRAKRLIREWFRHASSAMMPDLDVVVIARTGAPELSEREVADELCGLVGEATR